MEYMSGCRERRGDGWLKDKIWGGKDFLLGLGLRKGRTGARGRGVAGIKRKDRIVKERSKRRG